MWALDIEVCGVVVTLGGCELLFIVSLLCKLCANEVNVVCPLYLYSSVLLRMDSKTLFCI